MTKATASPTIPTHKRLGLNDRKNIQDRRKPSIQVDEELRVGDLRDSELVARRVAMLEEITCAAPAYIDRFGMPSSIEASFVCSNRTV
jgi:hypothetical protein